MSSQPFGVYVHVPFCASKCEYCAFATWTDRHHLVDRYLTALHREIDEAVAGGLGPASTVFIGGGTPSLVEPAKLAAVIAAIDVTDDAEVTVECNPDDVTEDLIEAYRSAGVNRISLGVQSMVDHVLDALGRRHDRSNVIGAVRAMRRVQMTNYNLDLIYGAVGESMDDWHDTVAAALELEPAHISAYALTVEAGTPLATQPDRHPDDDDQAAKYEMVDEMLEAAGLSNYEVSNWARPGAESRHNRLYWAQADYRGFGCSAHSHDRGRRWWNLRTPERYVEAIEAGRSPEAAGETLTATQRRLEGAQLAVRTREGVGNEAFDDESLVELTELGLIEPAGEARVRLTRRGRLLANAVSMRLH